MAFILMPLRGCKTLFQLAFPQAQTHNLTASDLATRLTERLDSPAVIVLSACHAGSLLADITAPEPLIIAAAAYGDFTPFACTDGCNWPEFGQS